MTKKNWSEIQYERHYCLVPQVYGRIVQSWILWQYCVRVARIILGVDTNQMLVLMNTAVGRRSPYIAASFLSS
jgi:hypothetical protein